MFVGGGCHTLMGVVDVWVAGVLSWCHYGASLCYVAPASGCEKGLENGARYLPEHTRW